MFKTKDKNEVRGVLIGCPNFHPCPLCYGCRNYMATDIECEKCLKEDKKKNICNKELHKEEILEKMIKRDNVDLNILGGFGETKEEEE